MRYRQDESLALGAKLSVNVKIKKRVAGPCPRHEGM